MKKATYAKPILLPVRPRWGTEKSLFCKGFAELQTAAFEGDDELIVAVKNGVLTGNKRQNDSTGGHRMNYTAKEMYSMVLKEYPDIMDIGTMCQALRISEKTGYKLIKSGQITALKVGRAYRIPKMHVLAYLKLTNAA